MRIRHKLLVIYLFVTCVMVFLLLFVLRASIEAKLFGHEKDMLGNSLQQGIVQMEKQIDNITGLSNIIYNNTDLLEAFNEDYGDHYYDMYWVYSNEILPDLYAYASLVPNVNNIKIYTSCDIVPYKSGAAPLSELEDQPYFSQVEGKNTIQWVSDTQDDVTTVAAVRKLPQNSFYPYENYLFINVKYSDLFSSLTTISQDEYGVVVVDADGKSVFDFESFSSDGQALSAQDLVRNATDAERGVRSPYLYLSSPVPATDWTVYYYSNGQSILRSVNETMVFIFFLIAALFVLLFFLTYFLVRTIFSPVAQLTSILEKTLLKNIGRQEIPIEPDRKDEIGTLIHTFNSMQKRIRVLIDEVYVQKLKAKEYQLNALRAQINPHFLYNTLSVISAKAIICEQTEISELVQLLSVFYRTSLNKGHEMTSIQSELENIRSYLSIQLVLNDHNFTITYHLDDTLLDCRIPCNVLQPLVENSIEHGLRNSRKTEKKLEISLYRKGEMCCIELYDNGVGIPPETMEILFCRETGHIGVKNVYERLKLSFGSDDVLQIQSVPLEYTRVILQIPIHQESNPEEPVQEPDLDEELPPEEK
jgi:two-component system sensor histidine kinase YesM